MEKKFQEKDSNKDNKISLDTRITLNLFENLKYDYNSSIIIMLFIIKKILIFIIMVLLNFYLNLKTKYLILINLIY